MKSSVLSYMPMVLLFIGTLSIPSCSLFEKDACAELTCQNGGICNGGFCDCPIGFLGSSCDSFDPTQIQTLLDGGQTPKKLIDGGILLDSLYGKTYKEGLIFYLNTTDGTGMVAAKTDQSEASEWGCHRIDFEGLNNVENDPMDSNAETIEGARVGDGMANTMQIKCDNMEGTATEVCRALGTEWFLPSRAELYLMYTNLHLNGYGGFAADYYWSSTEQNGYTAWAHGFENGHQAIGSKSIKTYIRAARAF
ncbi:hypothetical protein [uncultured Cyclobacterium sp.]|uniref:hypothetical protein n=1 Tax=uncultured Cyclobacterium sp. TaxID=453820 RepID=UPI0030ED0414|tara:strand:- start:3965 stop:4717 length:753 start_codon:yes stop_codon:yes gene_type:complete